MKYIFPSILALLVLTIYGVQASARTFEIQNTSVSQDTVYLTERREPELKGRVTKLTEVSAYSELDSCHTGSSCLMASGKKAYVGAVACPRVYKLGTKVYINGSLYTCEDRTSTKYPNRWDIFMGYGVEAHTEALKWGVKRISVEIIK